MEENRDPSGKAVDALDFGRSGIAPPASIVHEPDFGRELPMSN
jgi:hypothetical protein